MLFAMSNEQPARRSDEDAQMLALFRYQVVGRLVEEELGPGMVVTTVNNITAEAHYLPGSGARTVKPRTIYDWRKQYVEGGLDALLPKVRCDKGQRRALSDAVLERAIELRKEVPERWTKTLIDIMAREGLLAREPAFDRSTLDRHLDRRGYSRRRMGIQGTRRTIKMAFEHFGDLWVGDYHHGPLVRGPDGNALVSKIGAFLDHRTRYPVADRYYLSEKFDTLRDTLYRALLRWGAPKRIYVDNGKVYRARRLRFGLKRIDCDLVHSRPYYSEGRGLIERFWQAVKAFEAEIEARGELITIHELNTLWEAYREERYCRVVHSSLGMTPVEAIAAVVPRHVDPQVLSRLFLLRETRTVHKKDACVPVLGVRFRCEAALRGREVEVEFDPNALDAIDVFLDGQRVQRAFPQPLGEAPEPHREPPERPPLSTDYLALVRRDYDRRLIEQARPLAYADLAVETSFDAGAFAAVVIGIAGLDGKTTTVQREIALFWEQLGPLPEDIARIGVEHAARLHGRGRHPSVYLHAIKTLVLAHWRSSPSSLSDFPENER